MKPLLYAFTLTALGGCFYTETPYGRTAVLDLPVHSQTTINKTVTVNAPLPRLAVLFVLSAASSPCPDLNLIHYNFCFQTTLSVCPSNIPFMLFFTFFV